MSLLEREQGAAKKDRSRAKRLIFLDPYTHVRNCVFVIDAYLRRLNGFIKLLKWLALVERHQARAEKTLARAANGRSHKDTQGGSFTPAQQGSLTDDGTQSVCGRIGGEAALPTRCDTTRRRSHPTDLILDLVTTHLGLVGIQSSASQELSMKRLKLIRKNIKLKQIYIELICRQINREYVSLLQDLQRILVKVHSVRWRGELDEEETTEAHCKDKQGGSHHTIADVHASVLFSFKLRVEAVLNFVCNLCRRLNEEVSRGLLNLCGDLLRRYEVYSRRLRKRRNYLAGKLKGMCAPSIGYLREANEEPLTRDSKRDGSVGMDIVSGGEDIHLHGDNSVSLPPHKVNLPSSGRIIRGTSPMDAFPLGAENSHTSVTHPGHSNNQDIVVIFEGEKDIFHFIQEDSREKHPSGTSMEEEETVDESFDDVVKFLLRRKKHHISQVCRTYRQLRRRLRTLHKHTMVKLDTQSSQLTSHLMECLDGVIQFTSSFYDTLKRIMRNWQLSRDQNKKKNVLIELYVVCISQTERSHCQVEKWKRQVTRLAEAFRRVDFLPSFMSHLSAHLGAENISSMRPTGKFATAARKGHHSRMNSRSAAITYRWRDYLQIQSDLDPLEDYKQEQTNQEILTMMEIVALPYDMFFRDIGEGSGSQTDSNKRFHLEMKKFCATYRYPDDGDDGKEHPTEEIKRKCTIGEPQADQKIANLLSNPHFFEARRRGPSEGEPPDGSSLTDSRVGRSTGQASDQPVNHQRADALDDNLDDRSPNQGTTPQPDMLVQRARILLSDSLRKINCLGNVGDELSFGHCSKEGSSSHDLINDKNMPPGTVSTEEKDLRDPVWLGTFRDDVGRSEEGVAAVGQEVGGMERVAVVVAGEVDVVKADVGEDTAAPKADDADADGALPIEEQSSKSYDGCSEFSFDSVNEGVLDYIKKTYDKRRRWKLRARRKGGKKAAEGEAAEEEAVEKEAVEKEAVEKEVPEGEAVEGEATEKEVTEKDGSNEEAPNHDVANRGDKKGDTPNGAANRGDADLGPFLSEENYTYTVSDKDHLDAIARSSIKTYNCALMKKILLQGKIFITHDSVYFMSLFDSLFSKISIVRIPYECIEDVQKISVFNFIRNALKIMAKNKSFLFTSFVHRDHAYDIIMDMVRDNRLAGEIPKKGVVLYNDEENSEEEEAEEEETDEEDADEEEEEEWGEEGNESTKEPSQGEGPAGQGQPNRKRKKKKRPHRWRESKSSKKQHDKSVIYNILPTQDDLLMNGQSQQAEGLAEERTDEEENTERTRPPHKGEKKNIVIQIRSEIIQPNISDKEEELLKQNNFIKCDYHTDSLHVNEDFKNIFFDIFSQFDDKNPFVRNVQDKNPSNLSYEHLNTLNGELQSKGHLSYESVYNISLFDDDKRVFGMPARSDVKENLSFFFLQNVILIQKYVVLLCNVPLAGCFRTVITVTLYNVLPEPETDNMTTSNMGTSNGETPCTHIDFSYDIEFVKNTFFKYQIKNNALPELEIAVNHLKTYTQEAIERRYKLADATNRDNHKQNDDYTFVKDYLEIMTFGEERTFENASIRGHAETVVQSTDGASSAEPSHTAAWPSGKRYFKAEFNPLLQSVRHRLGKAFSATQCESGIVTRMSVYASRFTLFILSFIGLFSSLDPQPHLFGDS
ncbi:hypothetical protein C922_02896 [Plasmodium inui San Antonio 1]|uniref:GRAM domain-containing protein n=1 Tax=Plasmodium inui San Antonio 1 TaxID=1237626 RepID=W7A4F7_9APIC|nr:hypothetical protein C922_02896 [Plasmodium inui San Antonio 1]EUD66575.1 hypothetical protein C922_02896 [Plasmodium inui San Antonio 1]